MSAIYQPTKLYKYRSIGRNTRRIIVANELYFATADQFDDLDDCGVLIDFSGATEGQYRKLLTDVMPHLLSGLVLSATQLQNVVEQHLPDVMRDPASFSRDAQDGVRQMLRRSKGIYCLIDSCDVAQMWIEYADNHRGVCLEMAIPHVLNTVNKIDYVPKLPTVRYFDYSWEQLALLTMFTKGVRYEFESEWRIVDRELPPGPHQFSKPLVTGVIFGAAIAPTDRATMIGWLRDARLTVPTFQATRSGAGITIDPAAI